MCTLLERLHCRCPDSCVSGWKGVQGSARWHCCVVYSPTRPPPLPILCLFLSHGSSSSSSNPSFRLPPTLPSSFFLTPLFSMHSMYDRAGCTAGNWTWNHTVRIDVRCLKSPGRLPKDSFWLPHTLDYTHITRWTYSCSQIFLDINIIKGLHKQGLKVLHRVKPAFFFFQKSHIEKSTRDFIIKA